MNIGKTDYKNTIHTLSKHNSIKTEDEFLFHEKDSVHISKASEGENTSIGYGNLKKEEVPLNINLELNGTSVEKKIKGYVTDKEIVLNIKHTNDVHGNMPFVSTLIKPDDFWVDAGDAWQDHTFSSALFGGRKEVDLMNHRDCDIAIPGNHFYDDRGVEGGKELLEASHFPYLSANTKGMMPYIIADVEGVKIAFIGVRTEQKRFQKVDPSLVKDLEITDPVEAIKKSMEEIKSKGADNIIVLSHLGLDASSEYHHDTVSDKDLAKNIPGIDLIIGGHSHTPTFDKVEINGTRIVQAGVSDHDDLKTSPLYIGDLTLAIDRDTKKIVSIEDKLVQVDRKAPLDGDVNEISDSYTKEENKVLNEKLTVANTDFTYEFKTPVDSSLANLITDAMRKETGADVALIDSRFFSTRGKKAEPNVLLHGDITMKNLVSSAPWMGSDSDTRLETWNVTGSDIKKLLEEGVSKLLGPKKDDGLYQVSGLTMAYNPNNQEGSRVTEINIGGQPVDLNKSYKFTTTYNVGNWNKIFSDRNEDEVKDGPKLRILMADYMKKNGPLEHMDEGRIKQV